MCELGDEEISLKKPTPIESQKTTFRDLGYYTDSRGYKQYGVIPKQGEKEHDKLRIRASDS